jgi:hypothetical protein
MVCIYILKHQQGLQKKGPTGRSGFNFRKLYFILPIYRMKRCKNIKRKT